VNKRAIVLTALIAACAGLVWVLAKGFGQDPHAVPFMLEGKPAPAFRLKVLDRGDEISLDSLKGRPFVLNFWASWCGPCKLEAAVLDWGSKQFSQEVSFFGVVHGDTEENARGFLSRYPASYPQLLDPSSGTSVDYGIAGVPETYFIDKSGVIRHKHIGPIDPKTLMAQVRALQQ
jgi:cytochrome c biogenesis protein CcmG, thiol:disulfide interchange protein DsbE